MPKESRSRMQKWPSSTLCPPNSTVTGTTHFYPVAIRSAHVICAQALTTYGTQLGEISRAVLIFDATVLARRLNELQAFQALPGNKVDTSQAQATLNTLLTAVIMARQDVDEVS